MDTRTSKEQRSRFPRDQKLLFLFFGEIIVGVTSLQLLKPYCPKGMDFDVAVNVWRQYTGETHDLKKDVHRFNSWYLIDIHE